MARYGLGWLGVWTLGSASVAPTVAVRVAERGHAGRFPGRSTRPVHKNWKHPIFFGGTDPLPGRVSVCKWSDVQGSKTGSTRFVGPLREATGSPRVSGTKDNLQHLRRRGWNSGLPSLLKKVPREGKDGIWTLGGFDVQPQRPDPLRPPEPPGPVDLGGRRRSRRGASHRANLVTPLSRERPRASKDGPPPPRPHTWAAPGGWRCRSLGPAPAPQPSSPPPPAAPARLRALSRGGREISRAPWPRGSDARGAWGSVRETGRVPRKSGWRGRGARGALGELERRLTICTSGDGPGPRARGSGGSEPARTSRPRSGSTGREVHSPWSGTFGPRAVCVLPPLSGPTVARAGPRGPAGTTGGADALSRREWVGPNLLGSGSPRPPSTSLPQPRGLGRRGRRPLKTSPTGSLTWQQRIRLKIEGEIETPFPKGHSTLEVILSWTRTQTCTTARLQTYNRK